MVARKKKRKPARRKKKFSFKKLKKRFSRVLRKSFVLLFIAIFGLILYLHINNGDDNQRTVITSDEYNGIDVSKYQGNIDWGKVAKDTKIQFVYIKATEGATKVDSKYNTYIKEARHEGIKVGSYHYFIGRKSAKEQFDNFNKYVSRNKQDLIPMVDVEEAGNRLISKDDLQKNLNEFMQLVKEEYGKYPLLYSQYGFYKEKLSPEFDTYFLFIARYGKNPPTLESSGKHNIWQYTEKGKIDGINGFVDLDRFCNGTTLSDIEF